MDVLTDKQMDQILDLQIATRVTQRKSKKMSLKSDSHLETARKLVANKKHEAAKMHCCQSMKYQDLSKRALQKSMEIELVLDICKSVIETGKTTDSLSKLIKETAEPFSLAYEIDLETQMDDLSLRNNMLGVKLGESSLHTVDATPLYNQILHEQAYEESKKMPDLILDRNMRDPEYVVKHHN